MFGEQNNWKRQNPQETRGWEIVRQLNGLLGYSPEAHRAERSSSSSGYSPEAHRAERSSSSSALECRKLLAEYFKLGTQRPSRLHSAILSCAVKMGIAFQDFHFVPFLEMWGLENLRPEDSEAKEEPYGKRFPSLVERMTKAYAYSLMFHPEEYLDPEFEGMLKPTLEKKGYCLEEKDGRLQIATAVGYVEHIDGNHHHIHVYDNESRHFVAKYELSTTIKKGDYVKFLPIIPKESNFKSAIITSVLQDGAEAFGYRNVEVTFVSEDQSYCAWELLPDEDGKVKPIVETGAKEVQEPATKGYINKLSFQKVSGVSEGFNLPKKGDKLQIITFLKRGKDGKKRPFVVWYK